MLYQRALLATIVLVTSEPFGLVRTSRTAPNCTDTSDVVGSRACSVNARERGAHARRVTDATGLGAPCKGTATGQLPRPLAPAGIWRLRWRWACSAASSPSVALSWHHTNDSHGYSATAAAAWQARRRRRRATHPARELAHRWG